MWPLFQDFKEQQIIFELWPHLNCSRSELWISTKMYHLQGMTASAQLQAASRPQLSMHLQAAAATMEQQQLTNPPPRPASPFLTAEQAKQQMLEQYVPWVMKTYGDAAKTKVDFP